MLDPARRYLWVSTPQRKGARYHGKLVVEGQEKTGALFSTAWFVLKQLRCSPEQHVDQNSSADMVVQRESLASTSRKRSRSRTAAVRVSAPDVRSAMKGWNDVSFHGSRQIPTPNIDALAVSGVVLQRHYSTPTCSPSRAAFLTSRYPPRVAKTHKPEVPFRVIVSEQGTWQRLVGRYLQRSLSVLPVEDPCLIRKPQIVSEFLQQECPSEVSFFSVDVKDLYYSLPMDQVCAEWHLGYKSLEYTPTGRGFDTFFGYYNGLEYYYNHSAQKDGNCGLDFWRNIGSEMKAVIDLNGTYSTHAFTDEARRIIVAHDTRKSSSSLDARSSLLVALAPALENTAVVSSYLTSSHKWWGCCDSKVLVLYQYPPDLRSGRRLCFPTVMAQNDPPPAAFFATPAQPADLNTLTSTCNHWDEAQKLRYVAFYLKEVAKTWFYNHERDFPDWTRFKFRTNFRLARSACYELIKQFEASEFYSSDRNHGGVPTKTPEEHILSFLWYAVNKASMRDVAVLFDMAESTQFAVTDRVLGFLCKIAPDVIHFGLDKDALARDLEKLAGFPGVIGCIDGTYILMRCPANKVSSTYINRHDEVSMTMQGICNSKGRFQDVFTGPPSKVHDSRVLSLSSIQQDLPALSQVNKYHIVGDAAYAIREHLLTPFENYGNKTQDKSRFNYRLSSTRVGIEYAFALLKHRFCPLRYIEFTKVDKITQFIIACCVLHNICLDSGYTVVEDLLTEEEREEIRQDALLQIREERAELDQTGSHRLTAKMPCAV
ncbi:hypothetical protein HPB51_001317 [Rhipicephalus microplus]|uniref:DDE Tnp4 domain-containing protein n=1 Tax=Rhipicephalus microplus TaxID=6941 RepID=A0A9J6DYL4_RHIMP|nr:hypothetical protein HPB51_001317 [Rhipicephalus microplus]